MMECSRAGLPIIGDALEFMAWCQVGGTHRVSNRSCPETWS